jgi:hypothetical protein
MMALTRLLATLHDEQGNVAVEEVSSFAWDGADLSAEEFRASADLREGVRLTGSDPGRDLDALGPGYAAARRALEEAYGTPPGEAGSGGSIPLLRSLRQVAPNAEFIL